MATHSSNLAWRIPWTGEPGGLQSIGVTKSGLDLTTKQQQTLGLCRPCSIGWLVGSHHIPLFNRHLSPLEKILVLWAKKVSLLPMC